MKLVELSNQCGKICYLHNMTISLLVEVVTVVVPSRLRN